MSNDIRAALERLVELDDGKGPAPAIATAWTDAITAARAALAAAPVGKGPPAVTISALLHPAYEPGDGSADDAQMVGLAWWHPVMGCDSLQIVVDNARNILRSRWSRPAAPPAPVEGEAGDEARYLARELHDQAGDLSPSLELFDLITRAATLLEQFAAAAPVVVPVAVNERLPGEGDCDAEGRCWLLTVEDEYPQWRLHSVEGHQPGGRMIWVPVDRTPGVMVDAFYVSHWLPAHALPIPAPQGGEVEA